MSLPSQDNPNELTQQLDSIADQILFEDWITLFSRSIPLAIPPDESTQQMNSQLQPDVEMKTGSVAQNEDGSTSWRSFSPDISLNGSWGSVLEILSTGEQPYPQADFDVAPSFVAQTEDLSLTILTSKTDLLPPGERNPKEIPLPLNSLPENLPAEQLLNSQGHVEKGIQCFEPNGSHLDHEERPPDQASNGRKRRGRKPRVTPVKKAKNQIDQAGASAEACNRQKRKFREPIIRRKDQENERKMKKIESDRKYRENIKNELTDLRQIKPEYDRLIKLSSSVGGIDQLESQINRIKSGLHKLQQEEVGNDMFQQVIVDSANRVPLIRANEVQVCGNEEMASLSDKYKEMEVDSHRLELMKSKYGEIEEMEVMLDKFKNIEAEANRLEQMKSEYGEIEEIESMLDKFKNLEAESHRFEQIKLLFGGVDEIETEINRLKKIELQLEKHKQMVNRKELDCFQASPSPGSLQQLDMDQLYRQQRNEADFNRFEQMKSKFGGTEEMESKLDKFHRMEAELHRFEQIKSEFGGIDEIEARIYRLKKIESQHDNQKELHFFPESPGSLQELRGVQSLDLAGDSDMVSADGISLMSPAVVRETNIMHDMQYSDLLVTKFMAELDDDNVVSNVDLSSFKDLDGERKKVGKYRIPPSLVSTAEGIIRAYGDITDKCRFGYSVVETAYILLCAAIEEMSNLSLGQVSEEVMLKWRDAIKDANGLNCDAKFAMENLKKIAYGYFGLKAKTDGEILKLRMTSLKTEVLALQMELENKTKEMEDLKAKEEDLTSAQCKVCQKFADQLLKKSISVF
ncbi:uncharacterized protein LOC110412347 isoform X2 [Herrania umbratica]|uniref:Uncharacterized protein LOC110412347 isoform X2 n=1 Tax=Herrania umbratica TaxID=108875 RepID=A0A6J0ZUS0_9ROSI|nr:uncharacterized protein LOC110412347 isoform X2 [Herrania umbratica]